MQKTRNLPSQAGAKVTPAQLVNDNKVLSLAAKKWFKQRGILIMMLYRENPNHPFFSEKLYDQMMFEESEIEMYTEKAKGITEWKIN